jgi:hypothetical protein
VSSGAVKLAKSEAEEIANILHDLTRPRTDAEARKIDHYYKRLKGGRS